MDRRHRLGSNGGVACHISLKAPVLASSELQDSSRGSILATWCLLEWKGH